MKLFPVAFIFTVVAIPLVKSNDFCDDSEMKVGKLGPLLRKDVHIKECQTDGSCVSRFNLSLARGEQYRDVPNRLSMVWWGEQICIVHGRLTEGTKIRHLRCASQCYYTRSNLQFEKEGVETCTSHDNGTTCISGGSKSYWDFRFTDAGLPGVNTTIVDDKKKECNHVVEDPKSGKNLTLTFEDCINVTSVSGKSDQHRCDKVYAVDESNGASRKFLNELVMNVGQSYERLVMVGQDTYGQKSYGHDYYFTAWNTGEQYCVTVDSSLKKEFSSREIVEEKTSDCRWNCGEQENMKPLTTKYYEQKWMTPEADDFEVVKYIKISVKSQDGNGGGGNGGNGNGGDGDGGDDGNTNFGNLVQPGPVVVLATIAVNLFFGIAN